jgi:hypothetical protein
MTSMNQVKADKVHEAVECPIFLVGCERSGTTLLRLMLSHHPRLAFHFESDFIVKPLWEDQQEPVGAKLREFQDWLRADPAFQSSGFIIDESLPYRELVRSFLRQKTLLTGKSIVGMTVHVGFEQLPRVWPEARYVHLLRDGRDVTHSAMKLGWYGNAWAASEHWRRALISYDRLLENVALENVLEVRFEDLVSESEEQLSRISNFVGIPYDSAFFDYAETSSYSMPGRKEAANWRDHFDHRTIQLVESEIGDLLERHGYKLSGLDPIEITDSLRMELIRENTRLHRRWQISRYGLWPLVLRKLGDKINCETMREMSRSRMLQTRRKHLK